MSELILSETRGAIAVLILNIPKTRNALSREVLEVLAARLEALNDDASCSAIVLTGANGHFCSGGDVSGMAAERPLPVGRGRMQLGHRVVRAIVCGAKPVIAAVQGYAAGAGLSLVAAADYVVAAPSAKFVSSFAKVGLIPDLGLMWSLPQRIGLAEAKRLFITARTVEVAEALRLGLVDRAIESEAPLEEAIDVAREFTATAPLSTALLKSAYARGIAGLDDALRYEVDNQAALYLTRDHREAVAAFAEKRAPVFKGL